jgi:class 3 adenylate cyclase/predicted ATPase
MASIADFLKSIGMSEYAAGLTESGIDPTALQQMSETELERLGLSAADRRRLLRAVSDARFAGTSTAAPERRHITILFCDLVDSTTMSTRVDPEALHDILVAYREACVAAIEAANGFVAKYVGDGLLAYFGYPRAAEDDAERAVATALDLVARVGKIEDDLSRPLQARVGLASGLVLIGDLIAAGAAHSHDVVGETPNLAARLQARAEPGGVLISAETRRLVGGLFECASLGGANLKGFADPVEIWRVVGPNESSDRFRALRNANMELIGRDAEAGAIMQTWERAKAGAGGAILISGEPGIGKSRLAQSLVERLAGETYVRLQFHCAPNRQASTLFPFIAQLRVAAQMKRDDTPEQRLDKLESVLRAASLTAEDGPPLMAELLAIPAGGRYPPLDLTPQKRRARTQQIMLNLLEGVARQPTLVIFEDVHWIDPSSLELLSLGVQRARELPLLFLITARPEFSSPWLGLPHVESVALSRLSRDESAEFVGKLVSKLPLPAAMVEQIIERTEGVPLFLEELIKAVAVQGASKAPGELPGTLRDMLTARLDLLGEAKQVAQVASVFGGEFSSRLLGAVMEFDDQRLRAELAKLVEAEIVSEPSVAGSNTYRFKHALLQEAAYGMLSRTPRRDYHYKVAEAIAALQPEVLAAQPEILAQHYAQADRKPSAIEHWRAAGEKAIQRSANLEAINHLGRALETLAKTPASPERLQMELALLLAQGTALIAAKGFASEEVGDVYERAHDICGLLGNPPQLFPVLWGLWVFYTARANHKKAGGLAAQCRQIADATGDADLALLAHHAKGVTLSAIGEHATALQDLEAAVALYDRDKHVGLAFAYGQDSGVVCRSQAAFCLWFLGEPERALERNAEAIDLARTLSHPYSLAAALVFSAWIHQLAEDRAGAQRDAEEAIAISLARDFPFWLLTGMILRGWTLTGGETHAKGLDLMGQGLAGYKVAGAGIMRPYYLVLMAQALAHDGKYADAAVWLDEAEAAVTATGECWFEPEMYRLRGELALADGSPPVQAEAAFRRALSIAQRQSSRALERGAAESLAKIQPSAGQAQ